MSDSDLAASTLGTAVDGNSGQIALFAAYPFMFGARFLADHAGQIISEPRIAIVELVANAYDAGATRVQIQWPLEDEGYFEVADNGTGMTPAEFSRRWKHFNYNRCDEQGEEVEFPKGAKGVTHRKAFGQSGKGRHGAFCFDDAYEVQTARGGNRLTVKVRWLKKTDKPFDFESLGTENVPASEHGTRIYGFVRRNRLDTMTLVEAVGSKFLVDPSFHIEVNGNPVELVDISHLTSTANVTAETGHVVKVHRIDAPSEDRTTKLRGLTWWVNGKMVGQSSWEGLDSQGAVLDGRTRAAKRHSFVVMADCLKEFRRPDWSGFYDSKEVFAVKKAVHDHVTQQIDHILADTRKERKLNALTEQREALAQLPQVSREAIGQFIDEVQQKCPSLTDNELSKTVEVFTKLEKARSGYELLSKLATCSPADLDTWNKLMEDWTADRAATVLAEMKRRLDLIEELQKKVHDQTTDELHDLQPLFAEGLWIFGPEYDSPDFIANRQMTTVVAKLIKATTEKELSVRRPDFVVLPDRSLCVFAADGHGLDGEVIGFRKILILELKKGGFSLTHEEVIQGIRYAGELQKSTGILSTTEFGVFVLGSSIETADEMTQGKYIRVQPFCYEAVLRRAHSRTFHLQQKLAKLAPVKDRDREVDEVVAVAKQTLFARMGPA